MSAIDDLYQEVILDHYRKPRNHRELTGADRVIEGHNPLCGDHVTVFVALDGDRIRDMTFTGSGCAISTASASLMTEALKGRSVSEARALFARFRELVTGAADADAEADPALGKLAVLAGIRQYPVRVKCAILAWHALEAALEDRHEAVSTE